MKTEDEIMKELLQEELEREAAEIKKKIKQDPGLQGEEPDSELKNKIWQRADELRRQKEAYQNLSEADREALRLGRELQLRRKEKVGEEISEELVPEVDKVAVGATLDPEIHTEILQKHGGVPVRKRRKRVVVALAAALVAMLGLGITSFGDKGYVQRFFDQVVGNREITQIDAEKDSKHSQSEESQEEKIFEQIKDKFGFDPVRMDYKPLKMKMVDSMIDETLLQSTVYYEFNENIITYTIIPTYRDSSAGYDLEDEIVDEYRIQVSDVEIGISEYKIEGVEQHQFSAKFQYDEVSYFLTGIIDKEEFEKILRNLHFF